MSQFEKKLIEGKVGESEIADWFKARGSHVLPVYEVEKGQFAGPALYTAEGHTLIAPDMLCFNRVGRVVWVEAKQKTAFTFHRNTQRFTTGIDLHHYDQYIQVAYAIDWPLFILFLQKGGQAKDSKISEAGLFGGEIKDLMENENHRCGPKPHCRSGMVFWAQDKLTKYDTYPFTRYPVAKAG